MSKLKEYKSLIVLAILMILIIGTEYILRDRSGHIATHNSNSDRKRDSDPVASFDRKPTSGIVTGKDTKIYNFENRTYILSQEDQEFNARHGVTDEEFVAASETICRTNPALCD